MASSRAEHGTKDSLGPVILWASPALAAQVDKLAGVQWLAIAVIKQQELF